MLLAYVIIFSGVNTPISIVSLVHMRNTSELEYFCKERLKKVLRKLWY